MEKLTQEQIELLLSPLPSEAVKPHPTKTYLSSIKAIYVTERFNDVFGIGGWTQKVEKESVDTNGMVVVKVVFEVPRYGIYYESYGGNDNGGGGSKNFDLGDAYKGATTDALTKIGSYLGVGIDVFKGLNTNNTISNEQQQTQKKSNSQSNIKWLTDEQFELSKKGSKDQILNLLAKYNGKTAFSDGKVYGMKKQFRSELEKLSK